MALIKLREYEVKEAHAEGTVLQVTVPITWLRDHVATGDVLGLFIDADNPDRLVITKTPVNVQAKELPADGVRP